MEGLLSILLAREGQDACPGWSGGGSGMAAATGGDMRTALLVEALRPPVVTRASHMPAPAHSGAHDAYV